PGSCQSDASRVGDCRRWNVSSYRAVGHLEERNMEAWHRVSPKRRVAAEEVELLVESHRVREFIDTLVYRCGVVGDELRESGDTYQQKRTNKKAWAYTRYRIRGHRDVLLREMVRLKVGASKRYA